MMPAAGPDRQVRPVESAENDDPGNSGDARTPKDWLSLAMWSAPPMVPFEELQRTFAARYPASDPLDLGEGTVVVLPSLSFPTAELRKIVGIGYYEERLLFLLLLLRRPQVKVVYLTSMPVEEAVVDYYLSFLPDPAGARSRLHMLAAGDPAPRSLTASLLDSPVVFCAEEESWSSFAAKIAEGGAVVEELLDVPGMVSPSVQLRILPGGEPLVLSTHSQVLGGPNRQVYLGCRF